MILVNTATGEGYLIQGLEEDAIEIESGLEISASQFGVVPQYQFYVARIEHSFFDETYIIGCHAHGDPQNLLYLWSIVKYSILRYRESLLEFNGFAESSISSSGPDFDEAWTTEGGEKAWARFMTSTVRPKIAGIKAPHRVIESVVLRKNTSAGYIGGISMISNTDPVIVDKTEQSWYTDTDEEADATTPSKKKCYKLNVSICSTNPPTYPCNCATTVPQLIPKLTTTSYPSPVQVFKMLFWHPSLSICCTSGTYSQSQRVATASPVSCHSLAMIFKAGFKWIFALDQASFRRCRRRTVPQTAS